MKIFFRSQKCIQLSAANSPFLIQVAQLKTPKVVIVVARCFDFAR